MLDIDTSWTLSDFFYISAFIDEGFKKRYIMKNGRDLDRKKKCKRRILLVRSGGCDSIPYGDGTGKISHALLRYIKSDYMLRRRKRPKQRETKPS